MREGYGVGVRKAIRNECEGIRRRSRFIVGNKRRVKFWKNLCEDQTLKETFPDLFLLEWEESGDLGSRSPRFSRHLNDWEMGKVENLFHKLQSLDVRREVEDILS